MRYHAPAITILLSSIFLATPSAIADGEAPDSAPPSSEKAAKPAGEADRGADSFDADSFDAGFWKSHVRPVLDKNCIRCHGATSKKSDLDLRSIESLLAGGKKGPSLVAGKPEQSRLYQLLLEDAKPHMPPKAQLSEENIATVAAWIERLGGQTRGKWAKKVAKAAPAKTAALPQGLTPRLVIDLLVERRWAEKKIVPAERCSDSEYARRVYLDLAGRVPTPDELAAFLASTASSKREDLVEQILAGPDFPRQMREVFDVVLMSRSERQLSSRQAHRWYAYLETVFRENRPWNVVVDDLLRARPSHAKLGGSVWFLYERKNNHQAIAEAVAPSLLGIQVQCAQCHDHPVAPEIEQRHYWGLISFFKRSANVDTKHGPGVAESAIGGYGKFADLEGENHEAVPVFFTGATAGEIKPADPKKEQDKSELYSVPPEKGKPAKPAVPKYSRRDTLAKFVGEAPYVSRAFVNRAWALFLGRGIVHPVDKMDSAHQPSHPELLDWLAKDFASNGYDVHRLIREILSSRVYQLSSRPAAGTSHIDPSVFAVSVPKPLTAESLARSTLSVLGVADGGGQLAKSYRKLFPGVFDEEFNASTTQALYLTNNPAIDKLLEPQETGLMKRIHDEPQAAKRTRMAFEAILGRQPDDSETAASVAYLEARKERPKEAVKQLVWALLSGAEFRFNH